MKKLIAGIIIMAVLTGAIMTGKYIGRSISAAQEDTTRIMKTLSE